MKRERKRYMVGSNDSRDPIDMVWGRDNDDGGTLSMTAGQARKHLQYFENGQVYELVPVDLEAKAKK